MIHIQNRYVGDVGDFGKYGFLKVLCNDTLKLGVVWYLVPNESNSDGKFINYLEPSKKNIKRFKRCDPKLYETLKEIVNTDSRSVQRVRMSDVLPYETVFYEEPLSFVGFSSSGVKAQQIRLEHRRKWLQEALNSTVNCNVVFLDPDNGLEVNSVNRKQNKGPKYVYLDELTPFLQKGQSLIIYHHLCRNGFAEEQVNFRLCQIRDYVHESPKPWAVLYRRGTLRAFILIPTPEHQENLYEKTKSFLKTSWSQHFELIEINQ